MELFHIAWYGQQDNRTDVLGEVTLAVWLLS